jgi:Mg2+/Co2+ transporter CorB
MVLNLLDLQQVTVEHAMIPKNDVEGIDINDSEENINKRLIDINHTRMPIYTKSLNNIKGFLNKKHIPSMVQNNNVIKIEKLLEYSTEPYFIPEDTSLLSQLIIFKKEKKRIGCVVNEYGDIKGILTLDDILEEIVGEYSVSDQKDILMKNISQNKIEVHGSIQLRDINKRLGINLSDSTVTTINGYILEALQEIPQAGMTFKEDNIIIEVEKVHNNYVEKATITNNG